MGALIDHRDDQDFYRTAYAKVTFSRDGIDWEALARIYARAPLAVRPAVEIKRAFGNSYLCCFPGSTTSWSVPRGRRRTGFITRPSWMWRSIPASRAPASDER